MISLKDLVKKTTINVSRPEDLNLADLQPHLDKYNFAIIRGLVTKEEVLNSKKLLRENFSAKNDRPATGEHPHDLHKNFQKLSIGGAEQGGVYRPRCMRTLYNPIWADDIYEMRDMFIRMAKVRNLIYGFPIDFAIADIEGGFWTASRIHHYPSGAGFLVSHFDNVVPVVQAAEGINGYFQPILVMSKKGDGPDCDFKTGGGFFELDGTRYYFEEECELGDLVVYSGETRHGVSDIDTDVVFDQSQVQGRLCGFCTLYKNFTRIGELKDYIKPNQIQD